MASSIISWIVRRTGGDPSVNAVDLPTPPLADGSASPASLMSQCAYVAKIDDIRENDNARRLIALALITGIGILTGLYIRSPDLINLLVGVGAAAVLLCHQLAALRCCNMVRSANQGVETEAQIARTYPDETWDTYFDKRDLHFDRWKFTKDEWIGMMMLVFLVGLIGFHKISNALISGGSQ